MEFSENLKRYRHCDIRPGWIKSDTCFSLGEPRISVSPVFDLETV